MRPLDYLRILRRRWWILVVGALIGSLIAFVTRPSDLTVSIATSPKIQYRATHLLVTSPNSTTGLGKRIGYDRLSLMTIRGNVPKAAMAELNAVPIGSIVEKTTDSESDSSGGKNSGRRKQIKADDPSVPKGAMTIILKDPARYVSIAAAPDPGSGALAIVATGGKKEAPIVANAFAKALLDELQRFAQKDFDAKVADLTTQVSDLNGKLFALDGQIAATLDPVARNALVQRRAVVQADVEDVGAELLATQRKGPTPLDLGTLDPATEEGESYLKSPGGSALSGGQRQLVGGAIGFFLALALLVAMELLGARIRDVAGTEGAARMPVIAEIPVVKMNRADRFVVATAADPASLTAEAYRSFRTSLLAMWQRHPRNVPLPVANGNGNGNGHTNGNANGNARGGPGRGRPLRTLLVTSPGPAEGKSISVVNLAAAFAETGVSVIVIDADFRRPTQTRYLDRPRNPNLGDLDLTCTPEDLEAILQETEVPGVRLAASAPTKSDPGHAIAVAKAAAAAAEQLADIVIVDSPPILLANDAADIALGVDATVLLARSGWTRRSGIVASADLLRRLEATVIGVVIVGAEHGARAGYYGYYGYYGYGYGYAHPGEVSIMKKLIPWKGGRKPPTTASPRTRPAAPPIANPRPGASPGPATPPDVDDPWV